MHSGPSSEPTLCDEDDFAVKATVAALYNAAALYAEYEIVAERQLTPINLAGGGRSSNDDEAAAAVTAAAAASAAAQGDTQNGQFTSPPTTKIHFRFESP